MKIKSSILAATAGLLALAACQKEQELNTSYQSDPNAVIVNATLQEAGAVGKRNAAASTSVANAANNGIPTTRVNTESTGNAFVVGEDLFQVTNTTAGADPAKNTAHYKYTADKTWTLTNLATATPGSPATDPSYMTWLEGENTFEAYMPANTGNSYTAFTLPNNQSNVAGLRNADWMTATITKARSDQDRSINLAFAHKLAKVTVKITAYRNEFGSTPPTISGMQFKLPSVDILKGVTLPTAQGISPFVTADATAAALHSYTAILAPGKYTADADFLTMSIDGVKFPIMVNNLLSSTGLESGKSYTFDLTVGNHIVTINSFTVADWSTGDDLTATTPGLKIATDKGDNGFPIYEIYTADGLKAFADIINGTDDKKDRIFCGISIPGESTTDARKSNARLMADIDLSSVCSKALGKSWRPIGENNQYPYKGVFEGNLHTAKGLYMNDTRTNAELIIEENSIYHGLFGYLSGATVKNLTVEGSVNINITVTKCAITVNLYAGGIAGEAHNSSLTNCHSAVSVSAKGDSEVVDINVYAGGIVGAISGNSVTDCSSTGAVAATVNKANGQAVTAAGGICGLSSNTFVAGCSHTTGTVSGIALKDNRTFVGGIVGVTNDVCQFFGCTNTAEVKGTSETNGLNIGGIIGTTNEEVVVVACSNSGAIFYDGKGNLKTGGVVGENINTIIASFSTKIPKVSEGGSSGAQGKSAIGGVIGYHNFSASTSTCFYVSDNNLGTNGIGEIAGGGTTNTDGGRVANLTTLNSKIGVMNMCIAAYNTANPTTACPYHFVLSADGPQARK